MLFVHLFLRWQRENKPTQRQIPVEYRLNARILHVGIQKPLRTQRNPLSTQRDPQFTQRDP